MLAELTQPGSVSRVMCVGMREIERIDLRCEHIVLRSR